MLKSGSVMLYQVFPGNHVGWHRQFIKSIKENEVESVKNIITFFKTQKSFINAKETNSGNTALHYACRHGCYVSLIIGVVCSLFQCKKDSHVAILNHSLLF